ncbi:9721_t:CDS:2 [Racocetra fulgida]|uniref:9721_t:CDS:1 n=1 Tax=Racocetra fulgida TaxID=60492 RepID=A0A9N9FBA1_9GLOM|nr:9721_t:CDS:2 [Racocetra fulgida]
MANKDLYQFIKSISQGENSQGENSQDENSQSENFQGENLQESVQKNLPDDHLQKFGISLTKECGAFWAHAKSVDLEEHLALDCLDEWTDPSRKSLWNFVIHTSTGREYLWKLVDLSNQSHTGEILQDLARIAGCLWTRMVDSKIKKGDLEILKAQLRKYACNEEPYNRSYVSSVDSLTRWWKTTSDVQDQDLEIENLIILNDIGSNNNEDDINDDNNLDEELNSNEIEEFDENKFGAEFESIVGESEIDDQNL